MGNGFRLPIDDNEAPLPTAPDGMPLLYEDEDEGDLGEENLHTINTGILYYGVQAHLSDRSRYQVYSNLDLYYRDGPLHPRTGSAPYVSPDVMIVRPSSRLPVDVVSYTIGRESPAPVLAAEVLSARSAQQRDLREKLEIYARLSVPEYILVDGTGRFLQERLLLKRLRPNGCWKDKRDADGGITSRLGFRVILDEDGHIRVLDAGTGKHYLRPSEAQAAADASLAVEMKIRALEAEIARLRNVAGKAQRAKTTTKRRCKP